MKNKCGEQADSRTKITASHRRGERTWAFTVSYCHREGEHFPFRPGSRAPSPSESSSQTTASTPDNTPGLPEPSTAATTPSTPSPATGPPCQARLASTMAIYPPFHAQLIRFPVDAAIRTLVTEQHRGLNFRLGTPFPCNKSAQKWDAAACHSLVIELKTKTTVSYRSVTLKCWMWHVAQRNGSKHRLGHHHRPSGVPGKQEISPVQQVSEHKLREGYVW
jgi:hypothetical protein